MSNRLLVYDASAGSGKTSKLSEKFSDYLLEEIKRGNVKDAYRFIMAVTFTNKATFEMKSRIIERLHKRSKGISEEDRSRVLSEEDKANSAMILKRLVNDYTMFRVSTIDSFFQKVLKAFAVEMGSRSSYETTLDDGAAIEAAMDSLYSKLDTDIALRSAMESISESRIEEEKGWNWRDELLNICKRVLDSEYQNYKPKEGDLSLSSFEKQLTHDLEELQNCFVEPVIRLFHEMNQAYSESVLGKLKISSDLKKFIKGDLADTNKFIEEEAPRRISKKYPNKIDLWFTEPSQLLLKNGGQTDIAVVEDNYGSYLNGIKDLFDKYYPKYKSLLLIKQNIKESLLMDYVSRELDDYLAKEQLILLSMAPEILKDIINKSETPFVYEKMGATIDHYLLDEFQDTSEIQWNNFKPLIRESLSKRVDNAGEGGLESMLVGDVKQSIYRFRDGKWELFKDKVREDFEDNYKKLPLSINYRSLRNIVEFNNLLFSSVDKDTWCSGEGKEHPDGALVKSFMDNLDQKTGESNKLSGKISDIYKNSAQNIDPDLEKVENKGVVHVISCNFEEKASDITREDYILWDLVRKINYLTSERGYKFSEIAILTDRNTQAGKVANYLVDNGINIVSGESLKLDSNKAVGLLVEIMRKLVNPKDKGLDALNRIYGLNLKHLDYLDTSSDDGKKFMDDLRSCNTLYQMCKLILTTFIGDIDDGDLAFVKAFFDRTLDYSTLNGTSISDFLKWWDLMKDKFFIPEPSTGKAVQIMTMHKAKGLGFKVVFIPFLRDDMIKNRGGEKVWITSPSTGYNGPLLIPYSEQMKGSLYEADYFDEQMQRSVDNLNLAYVTFTRAKERLYIYAKESKTKEGKITKVSAALNEIMLMVEKSRLLDFNSVVETLESGETVTDFILGNDEENVFEGKKDNSREEEPVDTEEERGIEASVIHSEHAKISLRGVYDDDNVRRGVLYHELFSYIDGEGNTEGKMEEKVAKAVDRFLKRNTGSLIGDDADSLEKEVLAMIARVKEKGYGWFDEGKRIYGEQSIISEEGKNFRPDRIVLPVEGEDGVEVVDYKFGEYKKDSKSDKKYHEQVRNYMNLLQEMGYSNVKGFLWYVLEDEVVPV